MHFFSEPTLLNDQPQANAYGPDSTDPQNKFRVSAGFTVSDKARVFACQDSLMIVQPYVDAISGTVNPNLVNVILKPIKGLEIGFRSVKYYVYRGLAKNTFVSGTAIIAANSPDKTEFIGNFWQRWNDFKTNTSQPGLADPTPKSFGFDDTLADTFMVEEIFNSGESANNLINDFQAIKVVESEWIGNIPASGEFHFEVITDTEHLTIDLAYVRRSKQVVDVSALAGGTQTPEISYQLRAQRDKILNYIDPAAMFGMHYTPGVKISTYPATGKKTESKKEQLLYSEILINFFTRNRIYIDIRSEKGYSYNFYKNYGGGAADLLKVKGQPAPNFTTSSYYTNSWPVYYNDQSFNSKVIQIQLRVDDNIKPVLFVENPKLLGITNKNNFIPETNLLNGTAVDWTKTVKLEIPNFGTGTAQQNIAHHIELRYFRRQDNPASPNTVFKAVSYFDSIFGAFRFPLITVPTAFNFLKNDKRLLIKGNDFAYVSENGIYFDADKVIYYTINAFSLKKSRRVHAKSNFPPSASGSPISNPVLPTHIAYSMWQVNEGTGTVSILDIAGFNKTQKTATPEEDIFFLGITRAELTTLDTLPGISNLHAKFFVFEEIPNQADSVTGTPYKKYKLKVQGLNNVGAVITAAPATDIFVYSTSLNMVSSKDFTASTNLPNLLPDPGTMKEFEWTHRFDYDANDSFITGLFTGGTVKVRDNRIDIPNPKSGIIGEIHFPVETPGGTDLHPRNIPYPCVVVIHGNGHHYSEYRELCTHLAQNGFVVASISCLTFDTNVEATLIDASSIHANYYRFEADLTNYIYNNQTGTSTDPNYQYEKITVIEYHGTVVQARLLQSYVKDVDFSITVNSTTNIPEKITFLNKLGKQGPRGETGMAALARSNLLFAHLKVIDKKFNTPSLRKVQNNIGIIGHSRGGEAVLRAAKDIASPAAPANLNTIKAIISLAPTDMFDIETLTKNIPYYVLYGSRDGDVKGMMIPKSEEAIRANGLPPPRYRGSGAFSLYDRAKNNTEKAMSFVYGASHNGFITSNRADYPGAIVPESEQLNIAKAYMNAFLRMHLKDEAVWKPYFWGEFIPPSVRVTNIFPQYKKMSAETKVLKDFDGISLGTFTNNFATPPVEGSFNTEITSASRNPTTGVITIIDTSGSRLDPYSPHYTKGLRVAWAASQSLTLTLPGAGVDASALKCISFRIGMMVIPPPFLVHGDLPLSAVYSSLDQLKIRLKDASHSHEVPVSRKIPSPDTRESRREKDVNGADVYGTATKSAMMTIRIDLSNYSSAGVDLTQIKEVVFVFPPSGAGTAHLDEILFSN